MWQMKNRLIVIPGNHNAQSYVYEVLDTEAIPVLQRKGPGTLQHCKTLRAIIQLL